MYQKSPVSERVKRIREKCRSTRPSLDISRYRLVTEFYMENPQLTGILKRAKNLRNLFEHIPVCINEDELIVGWQGSKYRSSALYPEVSWAWFMEELRSIYADRVVLSLINNRVVDGKDFKMMENGAVLMSDDARKKFISKWQERKRSEITHPFLEEKIPWGLVPYTQALLMARFIRGDIEAYPPFMWK